MIAGFGQAGSTKAASGPGQHRYIDDPVFGQSMSYLPQSVFRHGILSARRIFDTMLTPPPPVNSMGRTELHKRLTNQRS
jgi:hypothetical protein